MKKLSFSTALLVLAAGCASDQVASSGGGYGRAGLSNARRITPLDYPPSERQAFANTSQQTQRETVPANTGAAPTSETSTETTEIPLYREELQVNKRVVPKGGIILRKVVETDQRSEPVQLRREEVVIERVGAGDAQRFQAGAQNAFQERQFSFELNREIPTIQKNAVVTEIVRARKVIDTRNETVSGTVRRESVDVDRSQATQAANSAADNKLPFAGSSAGSEQGSGSQGSSATATSATSATSPQPAQPAREQQENAEVVLHQEELQVGKRVVPAGRVVLRKNVTEVEVTRPVQLREEDVRIEREELAGARNPSQNAFTPREVFIPLHQEMPVVQKQVELSEVVRARKQIDTEQRIVTGEVRSERLEVGQVRAATGDANQNSGIAPATQRGTSARP